MARSTRLSVVIPTCNRPASLLRAVTALLAEIGARDLAGEVEIVVVDDASDAAARREVEGELERCTDGAVRLVRLARRVGPGGARNVGIDRSRGGVIAFFDDDLVPAGDYLGQTLAFHEHHPDVLVVNGNLRPLRDDVYSRFWFHLYDAAFNRPGDVYPVPILASGHFSIKRRLLDLLGEPLFDAALLRREDFDLHLRLKRRGIEIYKCDHIRADNDCRRTLPELVRQYAGYEVSQRQIVAKHGAAAVAAAEAERPVRRNWRFAHLYVLLRIAREAALLGVRLRRLSRVARPASRARRPA